MKQIVMVATALALAACARNEGVTGNSAGGMVTAAFRTDSGTLAAADAHCRQYGRTASIGGVIRTGTWSFNCVAP